MSTTKLGLFQPVPLSWNVSNASLADCLTGVKAHIAATKGMKAVKWRTANKPWMAANCAPAKMLNRAISRY